MVLALLQVLLSAVLSTGTPLTAAQQTRVNTAVEAGDATQIQIILDEIYD